MEIVYALHFTTSNCKDTGSSVENNALSLDSLTDIPFLPSIVSSFFLLFWPVPVVCYTAFLSYMEITEGGADVLYWSFSMNSSPTVALITRRAVEESSQLSCEAFPQNSSSLLFLYQSPWIRYLKPSGVFECGASFLSPLPGCPQEPFAGIQGLLFSWGSSSLCNPFHPCSNFGRGGSRHEREAACKCLSKMILL